MSVFTKSQFSKPSSNIFDLSHDRKFTGKIGQLIPSFVMDVVPGDQISINPSLMVKFPPMVYPILQQLTAYVHFFYVPNRLVWKESWEEFITGGDDGTATRVWPHSAADFSNNSWVGSLPDYMGLPVGSDKAAAGNMTFSLIPFAAYQMIYNEYYRDEWIIPAVTDTLSDGSQAHTAYTTLRQRAWAHDYFTSALPQTQKGPEAMLPLGTTAPVMWDPDISAINDTTGKQYWLQGNLAKFNAGQYGVAGNSGGSDNDKLSVNPGGATPIALDLNDTHIADLSNATASSINELRRAIALQTWLEKNARGGSRYKESILVHFGVRSSDARLDRPEYLGGIQVPIKIGEVPQTSETSTTPLGTPSGNGLGVGSGNWISAYCEEHGYILGIMSVRPKAAYRQGIPRHLLRSDKFDYFWPEFQHIGEQAIEKQELYWDGSIDDTSAFGYVPRYVEYKYINDSVHGEFRTTLDKWTMSRKFAIPPFLNQDFIECDSDEVNRVFAVTEGENLWCHQYNQVKAKRKMSYFGNPKIQ